MSERLLVLGGLLLVVLLVALWVGARPRVLTARLRRGRAPGVRPSGRPLVLAFTSPDCAACHAAQRPALEEFARRVGDQVEIREVDLLTERETARALGIFSVPSTVVLDADGRVVAFNIGFAPAERLLVQLPHTRNGGAATRS